MVFGLSSARTSPIGVDFGADSLKLLQLTAGDPPQLVAAATAPVPEQARGNPALRQAFFAEALKMLLKENRFKGRRAICSIPAYQTLIQNLQVSCGEGDDLETQISAHLRQRLNVNPSRMVLRHFLVPRQTGNKQEVICLAASHESVMRYIELARSLRLDVVGMHCEPVAILAAFEHLYRGRDAEARTHCFIDIGGATTKIVIAHGSQMVFAKSVHVAGDAFTRHFAKARAIGFNEARELRMSEDSPDVDPGAAEMASAMVASGPEAQDNGGGLAMLRAQIRAGERQATAAKSMRPGETASADPTAESVTCLIDELQMSLRYYQSLFPDRPVEKLVFLGGEARHKRLCQKIAKALRIGAQLGDPLARLHRARAGKNAALDVHQPQPGWAVPMGLCLSESNL